MFDIPRNDTALVLMQMVSGGALPRILQEAAAIGLGELLSERPLTLEQIADHYKYDEPVLRDVLAVLLDHGVLAFENGRYHPTEYSDNLDMIDQLFLGRESWACWGALDQALLTGRSVFEDIHGSDFFNYLAAKPDANHRWKRWNSRTAADWLDEVARELPLKAGESLCDIGGGEGALAEHILKEHPSVQVTVLDRSDVRPATSSGLLWQSGNMFEQVPAGHDVYLLSRVCCNWSDVELGRLFDNIQSAMACHSRLYLVDGIAPDDEIQRGTYAANSLALLLMFGGRMRTYSEFELLLEASDLVVECDCVLNSSGGPNWHMLCVHRRRV